MLKRLLTTLRRPESRPFGTWQIELTTRCPLACRMCARAGADPWQERELSLAAFRKILPCLPEVGTVVLEGWGESLLHPDLAQIVGLAKEAGPEVGFVTGGCGLTQGRIRELLQAGVDFMGFSLSGVTPAVHDAIRVHSRLPELLEAIRLVQEEKRRLKQERPHLHIVYLLLRDNIGEVPALPALARELGIREIVLINPCHIATPWQEAQALFADPQERARYGSLLRQAAEAAVREGVRLRQVPVEPGEAALCAENPLRNLYISAEGEVAPCVYAHPPLSPPFHRRFAGQEILIEKVRFGNLLTEPFGSIWTSEAYAAFRRAFGERQRAYRQLCRSLLDGGRPDPQPFSLPPPPDPCRSCHKLLGL